MIDTINPPITGVIDPSPFVYNSTLYTLAGLVGLAGALHLMVRPVDAKYIQLTKDMENKEKALRMEEEARRSICKKLGWSTKDRAFSNSKHIKISKSKDW